MRHAQLLFLGFAQCFLKREKKTEYLGPYSNFRPKIWWLIDLIDLQKRVINKLLFYSQRDRSAPGFMASHCVSREKLGRYLGVRDIGKYALHYCMYACSLTCPLQHWQRLFVASSQNRHLSRVSDVHSNLKLACRAVTSRWNFVHQNHKAVLKSHPYSVAA